MERPFVPLMVEQQEAMQMEAGLQGGGAGAGATVLKVLRVHCEVSILSKAVALSVWA